MVMDLADVYPAVVYTVTLQDVPETVVIIAKGWTGVDEVLELLTERYGEERLTELTAKVSKVYVMED